MRPGRRRPRARRLHERDPLRSEIRAGLQQSRLQYWDQGDYAAAIADFGTALGIEPRYANAYRNRGNTYLKMGDNERAISDLTTALGLNAKDTETLVGRALAYERTGDLERAIADFDSAVTLEPQNLAALTDRGYAHFNRGDFAAAAADLSRVMEQGLYTYPALFRFLAQSRAGLPASDLEPAARRMTNQSWPYAAFELYLGRRDPAATLAAAQKPEERCEAQFYVGEWHLLQGDQAAAKPYFEDAAGACPTTFVEYAGAQAELRRLGP
jgi:tetratricopeptide (TPR) repeat protein